MVTDRYQHVRHHPSVPEFIEWAKSEGMLVLAIDNVPGSVLIETFDLPKKCVLVFGQGRPGVSPEVIEAADAVLAIEQGSAPLHQRRCRRGRGDARVDPSTRVRQRVD